MFQLPTITKNLLIINVLVFLFSMFVPGMNDVLGLHYFQASHFQIFQLVSYMFMHGGFEHLFFNMFALWMFGVVMERTWGARRFLIYYIVCGIGAGLCQEIVQFIHVWQICGSFDNLIHLSQIDPSAPLALNSWTTVGASGSIYGILLAFGMTYPENRMFVFPIPFPIKAKWFVVGYAVLEVVLAISSPGDGIAHMAHLGGMLFGFFLIRYWRRIAEGHKNHFTGWESYQGTEYKEIKDGDGESLFSKIRRWFRIDRGAVDHQEEKPRFTTTSSHQQEWDENARRKAEDEEIDRILDKIRRTGYAGLSSEEKAKLFEASKK